ncbi:MAG: hypothetical protein P4L55_14275 [Syntrophobacteraceae bacterium]|nr:hypothetical protein [Syntrophobacteraceae bacterium]
MRIIIPAHSDHLFWMANNMSEEDREECAAMGLGPHEALQIGLEHSVAAWTGLKVPEHRPLCMFGVMPMEGILSGMGAPWFLSTPELRKYALRFLKDCDPYLNRMLDIFPTLVEYVDARHTRGIKWLKWLGFTLTGPEPWGPFGLHFYKATLCQGLNKFQQRQK